MAGTSGEAMNSMQTHTCLRGKTCLHEHACVQKHKHVHMTA